MSATDELRRLLDERGVEWMPSVFDPQHETFYDVNGVGFIVTEFPEIERLSLACDMRITPAQAIAATLGRGTCHADETDAIKCWVKCNDEPSTERMELIHVMECSACGSTYEHINGSYEFCPRCGRKVVDE